MMPTIDRLAKATKAILVGPLSPRRRPLMKAAFLAFSAACITGCSGLQAKQSYDWQTNPVVKGNNITEAQEITMFQDLGTWVSRPNESKDKFLLRVGEALNDFTEKKGYEACGYIVEHTNTSKPSWSVHLSSNLSHINCLNINFENSPIVTSQTETIHSHPSGGSKIKLTVQDKWLSPNLAGTPVGRKIEVESRNFSPQDYKSGPGYLVTHKHLLYQNTPNNQRQVGRVDTQDIAQVKPDISPLFTEIQQRISTEIASLREARPSSTEKKPVLQGVTVVSPPNS